MSKRKEVSRLLYEFAALVDKQTEKRKSLEYAENALKRAKKDYEEATEKIKNMEESILSYIKEE